jgi:hypothetical protein
MLGNVRITALLESRIRMMYGGRNPRPDALESGFRGVIPRDAASVVRYLTLFRSDAYLPKLPVFDAL